MYILWKKPDGTFQANVSNGYNGAVDPMPYFKDDMVYQEPLGWFTPGDWWFNGKRITRKEADPLCKRIKAYS